MAGLNDARGRRLPEHIRAAVSLSFPSLTREGPLKSCCSVSCAAGASLQGGSWKTKMRVKETLDTYNILRENYSTVTNPETCEIDC